MAGIDIIALLEEMAEHGTAPTEGCTLFGVGYEDAYERLRQKYLVQRFERGASAEKFVIGPFGSGKSHFSRQLMEIARSMDCVTAEVQLNKDLDFAQNLMIHREVARAVHPPEGDSRGIRSLLLASVEKVRSQAPPGAAGDRILEAWIAGLDEADFELEAFGRVAKRALEAHVSSQVTVFDAACRWLSGDVADRILAQELSLSPVPREDQKRHGRLAMLSLFQFIHYAGFRGTVVAYDEAEQGLSVDLKKEERIHSLLQSDINAIAGLKNGSVLVLYAFTPDVVDRMRKFPALAQRIADPAPDQGFFDGNTLAPRIDLTRRPNVDPVQDLQAIGHRLVDLLYQQERDRISIPKAKVRQRVDDIGEEIGRESASTGNRRTMVKRTCTLLVRLYEDGVLVDTAAVPDYEDEV